MEGFAGHVTPSDWLVSLCARECPIEVWMSGSGLFFPCKLTRREQLYGYILHLHD